MLLFFILLPIVGCNCLVWTNLTRIEDAFQKYKQAGEEAISSSQNEMDGLNSTLENFIVNIDDNKMLQIINILPQDEHCLQKFNINELKKSFRVQMNQLVIPFSERIKQLREKLSGVQISLDMLKGLADSRWWACKFSGSDCTEQVEMWLNGELDKLKCGINVNCKSHVISKRAIYYRGRYICNEGEEMYVGGTNLCIDSTTEESYTHLYTLEQTESPSKERNCSSSFGEFLCDNGRCISLASACDGFNDCGDLSDEDGQCDIGDCAAACNERGGTCFRGPKGPLCLSQCPLGYFETPFGCVFDTTSANSSIAELLDDLPRLLTRVRNGHYRLRRRCLQIIAKHLTNAARCRGGTFNDLGQVYSLIKNSTTVIS